MVAFEEASLDAELLWRSIKGRTSKKSFGSNLVQQTNRRLEWATCEFQEVVHSI